MVAVGITGHQARTGIDWSWVKNAIEVTLDKLPNVNKAYSSLAVGTDQIFAEVAVKRGIPLFAVIPIAGYDKFFSGTRLTKFQTLRDKARVIQLNASGSTGAAFFQAGRYIVDHSTVLLAVWDGKSAEGFGGTENIVAYARSTGRCIVHIEPFTRTVSRIKSSVAASDPMRKLMTPDI